MLTRKMYREYEIERMFFIGCFVHFEKRVAIWHAFPSWDLQLGRLNSNFIYTIILYLDFLQTLLRPLPPIYLNMPINQRVANVVQNTVSRSIIILLYQISAGGCGQTTQQMYPDRVNVMRSVFLEGHTLWGNWIFEHERSDYIKYLAFTLRPFNVNAKGTKSQGDMQS